MKQREYIARELMWKTIIESRSQEVVDRDRLLSEKEEELVRKDKQLKNQQVLNGKIQEKEMERFSINPHVSKR